MGLILFLIPALAATLLLAWYFSRLQARRRRASEVAAWLQAGLAGRGRVLRTQWLGPHDLFAPLNLEGQRLYSASAHAHLPGRRADHLTFRCDLDCPPRFAAEVINERWTLVPADSPANLGDGPNVETHRLGVYAISSGQNVVQNYRELMRSILNSQPVQVERLLLSPDSPHVELSVALDFDSPPPPAPFFRLLQRLADVVPHGAERR